MAVSQGRSGGTESDLLYEYQWQEKALPEPGADQDTARNWLIIGNCQREEMRLAQLLEAKSDKVLCLAEAEEVDPTAVDGVIFLPGAGESSRNANCHRLLRLAQALAVREKPPQLWIVTRAAQPAPGDGAPRTTAGLDQAALLGMGRVIINEQPNLRCRLVDIGSEGAELEPLVAELRADDVEEEIALRGDRRYCPRWSAASMGRLPLPRRKAREGEGIRLETGGPGVLENLAWRILARRPPGAGEIEIEIEAAGLNFRDVMKALGVYPKEAGDAIALGDECAGRIIAVGEGVEGLAVGDEVIAFYPGGCFASHLTLPSVFVTRKPEGMSFEDTATFPTAFLTAGHALNELGRLQKGERVLIHAATGGVGLAAIQIARLAGAEIFATAGSVEKRAFLHDLGIEHVMDSRSLEFADEIMERTGGRGVDIVLNSLAGPAIAKSLSPRCG